MNSQEVTLLDLGEEEMKKLVRCTERIVIRQGKYIQKPAWYVFVKELITEESFKDVTVDNIFTNYIQRNDRPALLWINNEIPTCTISTLHMAACMLQRRDVAYMLQTVIGKTGEERRRRHLELKVGDLPRKEKEKLAELLKRQQACSIIMDWRDFADFLMEENKNSCIVIMDYINKAKASMDVLEYIRCHYPYTTLNKMIELCRNVMKEELLADEIQGIMNNNARYMKVAERRKYNGSPTIMKTEYVKLNNSI